jgi:anti-anti-sigma factor
LEGDILRAGRAGHLRGPRTSTLEYGRCIGGMDANRPRVELRELSGHTSLLALVGEHDLGTHRELREKLEGARLAAVIVVDLTRCTFIDSTTIGALVGLQHAGLHHRVELVLPPAMASSRRALDLIGVDQLFSTHLRLDDALAAAQPNI